MPDIDIDFCFRNRERVIDYVTGKYGRPNVAQIITFGTMAARAVIRDAGRGLEIPYAEVDRIAKLVPQQPGQEVTIEKAMAEVPQLKQAYDQDAQVRQLLDVAQRLEGLVRHASTHAAGVVIAPKPIVEFAPLYKGQDDAITTQFSMSDLEEIGLIKMDFLGLKTLTLIDDAVASIEQATGSRPDMDHLPIDDPKVYELFGQARTAGLFQFESEGMRNILRRLKPDRFEDLIALNALYRPGPIGGGLIDDFVKRRHGKIKVEYPHPWLEESLQETYGVIVYQEQVMQIASRMGGYSLGEADILRRAMGKKKKEAMAAEREKFVERAVKQGVKGGDAGKVFDLMEFFAGYGFNKSHSAAYALVAYRTAWLKAHHPVHFMAALLTTEKGNTDKLVHYVGECREMGIEVLPPDVNSSSLDFSVDGDKVRFGLSAIKNVGEGAIASILDARRRLGRFRSLHELCAEIDLRAVNKRVLEALVSSGAMDSLGGRRSSLAAAIDGAMEWGAKRRDDRESGQASLFGGGGGTPEASPPPLPDLPDWDDATRLANEKATLGFYVSGHPLESFKDLLQDFATHTTSTLREAPSGGEVAVGGIVTDLRKRKSKKGQWWASLQLEDLEGHVETLVFPKTFEASQALLENGRALLVTGRAENEDGRVRLTADDVMVLDDAREKKAQAVQVRLDDADLDDTTMRRLRKALEGSPGELPVYLELVRPGRFRMVARAEPSMRVGPSPRLLAAVEEVLGPGRLRYRARVMGR
jgi:DNA polymerase-3 subunit alpha